MTIQEVKSAKGITAWLVEDHTVPIIAIRFVFDGGTAQDPGRQGRPHDQEAVDRIRAQIFCGIIANERDPETIAQRKWRRAIYGTHLYSRPDEGTKVSLAGITPADLGAFHQATFAPDGLHVAVVGHIDAKTVRDKLDQLFGDLREKQTLSPVADVSAKLGQQVEVNYDLPQTSLRLAFPGFKRSAPDFFPAELMKEILGGSAFTSRLFDEVREKRGLAYGVRSYLVDITSILMRCWLRQRHARTAPPRP
ncbi:pitrilysin family protein [Mesorhizobium sp. M1169]|uniref:M16 family metallopeptidase n=1 Tax=Mesorhizobium sp. M1169 TaxID=2957066 RepID=UPI0033365966